MNAYTIVERLKNGDIQALRLIYELFYKSAYKAAFFVCNDAGLAEDAVHETFLKLPNKIDQLKDPAKLQPWLCRIAANTARDTLRQLTRRTLTENPEDICPDDQLNSPEKLLLNSEEKHAIQQAISCLRIEYKQVIYLKYYENMSTKEISLTLGIPDGTVRSRLSRAREEIGKLLKRNRFHNRHKVNRLLDTKEVKR